MGVASFLADLQRRHVVRAAIAHVIFFWLLLQLAEVVMPYLGVVDNPVQWALVAGVALFPVTLAAAWFFEHPWHTYTGSRIAVDAAVLLVIAVTAFGWVSRNLPEQIHSRNSIVVLPFSYEEDDSLGAMVSRALAYEISNLLLRSGSLEVTGFESAVSGVLTGLNNAAIAERLDVEHLLTGSIVAQGELLALDARLLNRKGTAIWSISIEDSADNLARIENELAESVSAMLAGDEGEVAVRRVIDERCEMPTDPGILERYYEARHAFETRWDDESGQGALHTAIALYEELTDEHPQFAQAHAGLAWSYILYPAYNRGSQRSDWDAKAEASAETAISLCDTLGEALVILPNDCDDPNPFVGVAQNLQCGLELDPANEFLEQRYVRHLRWVGRNEETVRLARQGYRRNPLSVRAILNLAGVLQYLERRGESSGLYDQARELGFPGENFADGADRLQACNQDPQCLADNSPPFLHPFREQMIDIWTPPADQADTARKIELAVNVMQESRMVNWFNMTACHFDYLTPLFYEAWEYSKSSGEFWYWPNVFHVRCGNVWESDQFPKFAEETGMVEYWQRVAWPDMCRADGDSVRCADPYSEE